MSKPYHKYVFDTEKRSFVGRFEDMYREEEVASFDSWHQEDLTNIVKQVSITLLSRYNFSTILDIGCGKGTFTHLLKKENNFIKAIDVSDTAIKKAKAKYPAIEFTAAPVETFMEDEKGHYDLVVVMEMLSYLEEWQKAIESMSRITRNVFITLYIPVDPIGYVKSFDDLCKEVEKYFDIEIKVIVNDSSIILFAKRRH